MVSKILEEAIQFEKLAFFFDKARLQEIEANLSEIKGLCNKIHSKYLQAGKDKGIADKFITKIMDFNYANILDTTSDIKADLTRLLNSIG